MPKAIGLQSRTAGEKDQPTIAVPILRTRRPRGHLGGISESTWEVRGRATSSVPFGHEALLGAVQKESPSSQGSLSPLHAETWFCEPLALCLLGSSSPARNGYAGSSSGFPQSPGTSSHSPNSETAEQSKVNKALWIEGRGHCPHSGLEGPEGRNRG